MNEFVVRKGNYIKDRNSTNKIINNVFISLVIIAIISYFIKSLTALKISNDYALMFKALGIMLLPVVLTYIVHYLWYLFRKDKKSMNELVEDKTIITPIIIMGILSSINTSLWILLIVTVVINLLMLIFKGYFDLNINPTIIGLMLLAIISNGLNITYELFNVNYVICLIFFIFLVISKSIKYKISIYGLGSLVLILVILNIFSVSNINIITVLNSSIFILLFIECDMITTPVTKRNQIIYGIMFGFLVSIIYVIGYDQILYLTMLLFLNIMAFLLNKYSLN